MSLDGNSNARAGSPASGRSSPSVRIRQKDDEDFLKKDKGFRRYASAVNRVLAQFTAVEEWADYVSFLSRLLKALQGKPSGYSEIAHKQLVAKRLSQCLDPSLGTGVHQKTLEVYSYIFSTIGKDGLSTDLSLYLPGLAPTLSFASLSVKPNILKLFESYVVKLDAPALRPALKALILSLLPSLEEENSEEFEWALRILDGLKLSIAGGPDASPANQQYFWQCLFLASITSSTRRSGALAYLVRNLPPLASSKPLEPVAIRPLNSSDAAPEADEGLEDVITAVALPDPGLLIRCFCSGLRDEQLLIQRGFLDLLVTHLPLHSDVLQKNARSEDMKKLVTAATSVVARRDMSLNRRLWSWFLGPEPAPETPGLLSPASPRSGGQLTPRQDIMAVQSRYFERYGLVPLVATIKSMIMKEPQDSVERSRPLRICLSMMDRWEIGSLIVPQVFLISLQSAWRYRKASVPIESYSEVLRSANMFFDAVESSVIWSELAKLVAQSLAYEEGPNNQSQEILEFVLFIINNFNVREEEMQIAHMPLVSIFALLRLRSLTRTWQQSGDITIGKIVIGALQVVSKLIELIPTRVFKVDRDKMGQESREVPSDEDLIDKIERFYTRDMGNIDVAQPVPKEDIGTLLLHTSFDLLAPQLQPNSSATIGSIELTVSVLSMMVRKGPRIKPDIEEFVSVFQSKSGQKQLQANSDQSFAIVSAKVLSLETIFGSLHSAAWMPKSVMRGCIPGLVADLWPGLSPSRLKHNVEAARSLWKLQSMAQDDHLIESTIVTLMISEAYKQGQESLDLESARRFATLWAHSQNTAPSSSQSRRSSIVRAKGEPLKPSSSIESALIERPLILMLDTQDLMKSPCFIFVTNWLQALPTMAPILEILVSRLIKTPLISNTMVGITSDIEVDDDLQDSTTSLFYLEKIVRIIDVPSQAVWHAMDSMPNSPISGDSATFSSILINICMSLLDLHIPEGQVGQLGFSIKQTALTILSKFFSGPLAGGLAQRELEIPLLEKLQSAIHSKEHTLQTSIMEVLLPALKMRIPQAPILQKPPRHERKSSRDVRVPSLQVTAEESETSQQSSEVILLPPQLLECLSLGISSPKCRPVLEGWIAFLTKCLPLYEGAIFQILFSLVEIFCDTLNNVLEDIQGIFTSTNIEPTTITEATIALLLNGLEQTLAAAHEYLENEEAGATPVKSPDQQQTGFFGNMVSGVFTNDSSQARSKTANKRLTVLLCFKDAIRVSFRIWLWGDSGKESSLRDMSASASFNYTTVRLRNRTRRLFEHLFAAEPLECLETLIDLWQGYVANDSDSTNTVVLNLLNTLENSRPKNTIPALFDAIYSRTNPGALDPNRKSTLTSNITDTALAAFLVTYSRSLDDDAMDEIWADCSTFLKDVLTNPMPHRQTLYRLLEFSAVLGGKVDNTNFGEQRKMRRELGDLFNKLLAATLTIRPMGLPLDTLSASNTEKGSATPTPTKVSFDTHSRLGSDDLVSILATVTPDLPKILIEPDRIAYTSGVISTQILLPIFRSKSFPSNVNNRTLDLMKALAGIPEASKTAKKDVTEAFNDLKFFSTDTSLVKEGWLPVLRSWVLADKERLPELLSRLTTPTAAGFLGVGASSARLEADKKTQLNLRRIATLILAAPHDAFVVHLELIQEKVVDLLSATSTSSPSTITRSEIYMVIRAMLIKISVIYLSPFWPTINSELFDALSAAYPGIDPSEALNPMCILQACKLLDALLLLDLDDFQMQEWLFVRDTTDAVYPTDKLESTALADDLAESLDGQDEGAITVNNAVPMVDTSSGKRRLLLTQAMTKDLPTNQLVQRVIRPFLTNLSIQSFESTYGMLAPDLVAYESDLIADIFDEDTLV